MSPEQLSGSTNDIDARSDVYAIGVLFYRLITGRLPFDLTGLSWVEAAERLLQTDPAPLAAIDLALEEPLNRVAARAMSRDRTERYQTAAELAADLRACLDGRMPAARQSGDPSRTARDWRPIVATSFDDRLVAIGLASGVITILDARSGRQIALLDEQAGAISSLVFRVDGRLGVGRADGRVEIVDVPS
jgi:serine/threonine protein kinase